jgi:hypothetical protein
MANESEWDRELARIDRQLASISDEALAGSAPASEPSAPGAAAARVDRTPAAAPRGPVSHAPVAPSVAPVTTVAPGATLAVMARLGLATALGIAILFWPYPARCGTGLALYLASVGVVAVGGLWSAIWSWRHRWGRAHSLSLLLVLWGLVLGAREVLPRVGYAYPDGLRTPTWTCER